MVLVICNYIHTYISVLPWRNINQCIKKEYFVMREYVSVEGIYFLIIITMVSSCSSASLIVLKKGGYTILKSNKTIQQNQRYCLFYSTHSSSLSKSGAFITHNSTSVQSEMQMCQASIG